MNRLFRTAVTAAIAAIAIQLACSPEARAQCALYGLLGGPQDFHDPTLVTGWSGGNGLNPSVDTWEVDAADQNYHRTFGAGAPATYYGIGNAWADYDFSCNFSFPKRCNPYEEDFSTQATVTGWSGGNGVSPGDTWTVDAAQQAYRRISTGADGINRFLAGAALQNYEVRCNVTLTQPPTSGQARIALYGRYQAGSNNANLTLTVDSNGITTATYSAPGGSFAPRSIPVPTSGAPNSKFTFYLKFQGKVPTAEITPSGGTKISIPFQPTDTLPNVVAQGTVALEFDTGTSDLAPDSVLFDDICVNTISSTVAQPAVGFYARYKDSNNCVKLLLTNGLAKLQAGTSASTSTPLLPFDTTGTYAVKLSVGGQSASAEVTDPSGAKIVDLSLPTIPSGIDKGGIGLEYDGGTGTPADLVAFDNVCVGGTIIPQWTNCVISPNPVGRVDVGVVKATITLDQPSVASSDLQAYLVPQGVKDTETSKQIPLNIAPSSVSGAFDCVNTIPITTFLNETDLMYHPIDRSKVILDGHAHVNVTFNHNSINLTAAAEKGRHLLIDTIPPMVVIVPMSWSVSSPETPPVSKPDTDALVTMYNESPNRLHFAAHGINAPTHPYPMTSTLNPNGVQFKPDAAWQLDGEILTRPCASPYILVADPAPMLHPTVLYNIGSASNATGNVYWNSLPDHDRLDIEVKIAVLDQSVYEKYGLSTMSDRDTDSSITDPSLQLVRQTAGIALCVDDSPASWTNVASLAATVPSALLTGVSLPLPGAWMGAGLNVSGVTITTDQAVANPGYFDSTTAPVPDMDLSRAKGATVHLRFVTAAGTGIPLPNAADFDFTGPLVGQDRVNNRSDRTDIFEPYGQPNLHVQWNRGDDVMTLTFVPGAGDGTIPTLNWEDNTLKEFPPYGPYPLYTFSAWRCTEAREENKNLPYELLLDWKPWDLNGRVGPANFDPTTVDQLKDRYVMIVAAKMDAAGNVTPWDDTYIKLDSVNNVIIPKQAIGEKKYGSMWYRFHVPGESSLVDTTIDVNFEYTNPTTNLGPATIIQYPRTADRIIVGEFDIGLVTGLQTDLQNAFVVVELEQDGRVVFRGALPASGADTVPVNMPAILENPPDSSAALSRLNLSPVAPLDLSDLPMGKPPRFGRGDRVVNYVFRAYTVVLRDDGSGNWILPPIADTSPVNFGFKVVPGTIENFLESSGGEQPIKIYERE